MKSNLRNEIKSYIVRQGMTMLEVVDLLADEYGWSDSVSNLPISSSVNRSAIPKRYSLPTCWALKSYGRKDRRSDAPATAPSHLPSP